MTELYVPEHEAIVNHLFMLGGDSQAMHVSYGVRLDDPISGDGQTIADDLHAAAAAELLPMTAKDYQLTETQLRVMVSGDFQVYVATGTSTSPSTSAPAPQNTATLVHKRTASAGRRFRGRMYLPGVSEGSVNGIGVLDGSFRTALQTRADDFLAAVQAVTDVDEFVLFHTPRTGDLTPSSTIVTTLTVDAVVATQRRRLRP